MGADVRAADEWWGSLTDERRCAIHRWVSKRPALDEQPEDQTTIDDLLTETT